MKRTALTVLVLLLAMAAFATGSQESTTSTGGTSSSFEASRTASAQAGGIGLPIFEETRTIEVTLSEHPSWPNTGIEDGVSMTELLARTNGAFKLQSMPNDAYQQRLGIMLNTGDLPEMLVHFGVDQVLSNSELFLNIWPYVDDHMPNFKANVVEALPELALFKPSADEMYTLPHTFGSDIWLESIFTTVFIYRMDVLDELGLEVPKTLDEFEAALRAMKAAYPDAAPFTFRQGMGSVISTLSFPFNLGMSPQHTGSVILRKESGVWSSGIDHPNFKAMVEWLHGLYAEGLLDSEYPIVWNNTRLWEEKMTTGRALTTFDYYGRPFSLMSTAQAAGNDEYEFGGQLPPVADDIAGSSAQYWNNFPTSTYLALKADIEDPEHVLEFIDYVYFSEEGAFVMAAGVEGETYEMTGPNSYTWLNPGTDSMAWTIENGVNRMAFIGFNPTHFGYAFDPNPYLTAPLRLAQDARFRAADPGVPAPTPLLYTADELEIKTEVEVAMRDMVEPNFMKFITGERPMSEWDEFISELYDLGMQSLVDIANDAQARIDAAK